MIFNLKQVTGRYVKEYLEFLKKKKFVNVSIEELFDLFSFSIETIYGLPAAESSEYIKLYGDECIAWLKKTKNVPKRINRLGLNDKVAVVSMCKSFFLASCLLADKDKGDGSDGGQESL